MLIPDWNMLNYSMQTEGILQQLCAPVKNNMDYPITPCYILQVKHHLKFTEHRLFKNHYSVCIQKIFSLVFQYDGAPLHFSKLVQKFLESQLLPNRVISRGYGIFWAQGHRTLLLLIISFVAVLKLEFIAILNQQLSLN